jgi:arsenate reductase
MAEAYARRFGGDRFDVHSAGLKPTDIHPLTRAVLEEDGVDMTGQTAKGVDTYLGKLPVHYLFIVCDRAAESCPSIWPGAPKMQRIVRTFADPAAVEGSDEEKRAAFRRVRDEIKQEIKAWMQNHAESESV